MNIDDHVLRRRIWLLTKALEAHPLSEALPLARSAEEFLVGNQIGFGDNETLVAVPGVTLLIEPNEFRDLDGHAPGSVADTDTNGSHASAGEVDGLDATVVVGTVDDVVLYLRRQDDVVVPQKNGLFLINGRFLESLEQLLNRVNRSRKRRRLPAFVLMPSEEVNQAAMV